MKLSNKAQVIKWWNGLSEAHRSILFMKQYLESCNTSSVYIARPVKSGAFLESILRVGKRGLDWFDLGEPDLDRGAVNLIVRPIKGLK